jgi:Ca2+-binding EF-hand superfamily protein
MAATSGKRRSFNTDLEHLRKCFDNVDHQRGGFIGLEGLTKLVDSMPDTGDSVVTELMEKLDRDKDGKVRLQEGGGERG